MKKLFFVGILLTSPLSASADQIADLQVQIQSLLVQITALKAQMVATPAQSLTKIVDNTCPQLTLTLSRGTSGADVKRLQQFLISQNLLISDSATGYFGLLTERAVQQWQTRNDISSSGTPATTGYGVVGPKTRATIARCGKVTIPTGPQSTPTPPTPPSTTSNPSNLSNNSTTPNITPDTTITLPVVAPSVRCTKTLRELGVAGDGTSDDTASVQKALDSGCELSGEGRTYLITGSLNLLSGTLLTNAIFIERIPRTRQQRLFITKNAGTNITLRNITIQRGEEKDVGDVDDAAIRIRDVDGIILENIEITGNGRGGGIHLIRSKNITIRDAYVHDMEWESPLTPYEQMFGIWINGSINTLIERPRIANLRGKDPSGIIRPYQADGITLSGTDHTTIRGANISYVWEGIDITGSDGNKNFVIENSTIADVDAFCFKIANTNVDGVIQDTTATRCGYAGYVVAGKGERITIIRAKAIDIGSNGNWQQYPVSGFLLLEQDANPGYPRTVSIRNAVSDDTQSIKTMKYGFYSQVSAVNGIFPNTVRKTDSYGQLIEGSRGFSVGAL